MARQDQEDKTHFTSMTLALIKPDAFERRLVGEVLASIEKSELELREVKMGSPDVNCWMMFYLEHQGRSYYDTLINFMASGPVLAMILTLKTRNEEWKAGEATPAVREWRALMGASSVTKRAPGTIRHRLAYDQPEYRNLVHGSDSDLAVERELAVMQRWSLL